jgi:hypothetical protein
MVAQQAEWASLTESRLHATFGSCICAATRDQSRMATGWRWRPQHSSRDGPKNMWGENGFKALRGTEDVNFVLLRSLWSVNTTKRMDGRLDTCLRSPPTPPAYVPPWLTARPRNARSLNAIGSVRLPSWRSGNGSVVTDK